MGEKVKHLRAVPVAGTSVAGHSAAAGDSIAINRERADVVLPVLAQILGVQFDGN
jgi:hypothetical protein